MSITINEDDAKLFQQNGFSYDDVNDTVEHYRNSGLKDDEIQKKINSRINEFKTNKNQGITNIPKMDDNSNGDYNENAALYGYISAAPKRNIFTNFLNCLKWVGNTTMAAYQEGNRQTEIADLEAKDMFHTINAQEKNRLEELSNTPSKTYKDYGIYDPHYFVENETNFLPRMANKAKKGYVEAINMLPYMWETIKAGGIGAGVGTVIGGVAGAGAGLATTKANAPQLALQGARIGGAWGGRITGTTKIAELEGGLARNELKQINKEIIEKGGEPLSEGMIDTLAVSVGAVNAGLEMVGLKQVLKTVPNGDKILQYLEKKNLRELATNQTIRSQLTKALGQYAKAVGTEITTEMAQETTNIVADEMARKFGKVENTPLEQNVARVLDTGKATFGAMAFIGGVGTGAKCVSIMVKKGVPRAEAEKAVAEMSQEETQNYVEENYDTLMDIAKGTTGTPEEATKKVEEDLTQRFIENKTFAQEKDAKSTAALFATSLQKLSDVTGLSIDEVMEEEMPDIVREAGEIQQDNGRYVQTDGRIEAIFNEIGEMPDDFSDEKYIDDLLHEADILEKVREGGLKEEDFNDVQQLISSLDNSGQTDFANELRELTYNQTGQLFQSVSSAGATGGEISAAKKEWKAKGTESKYFQNWFGDSQVVDDEGKPLVVYHGTEAVPFSIFGKGQKGWATENKRTYYFSASKDYAKVFAGKTENSRIMECYLSLKNPLVVSNEEIEDVGYWLNDKQLDELEKQGYDGFITEDKEQIVVLHPEQIKSVNNQGTFDKDNPNIYYQKSDRVDYNPNLRKVQITNKNNAEVELNNSLWIPTEIVAMEGTDYKNQKVGASFWMDFGRRNLREYNIEDLGDFPEEENTVEEKAEHNAEIEKIAEKHFGTTTNTKEAGYVLSDGKLLDFSGKKFGGVAGRRSIDHREINDAFLENEKYDDIGFDEFIDNGAIRYMPEASSFLIARMPSEKQFNMLEKIINQSNGEVSIEMVDKMANWGNSDKSFQRDYEMWSNPKKILDDVRVFFKGGKISNNKKYFQSYKTNYRKQLEEAKNSIEYKKFVNKVLSGEITSKQNRKLFTIGRTPDKLIEAGVPQNNLTIGAGIIRKAQNNKNSDHNLSKETISKVYDALKNPIAVIRAEQNQNKKGDKDRIAVILDLQNDKKNYVMAAIEINKKSGKATINDIRSIHSRESYAPMLDAAYKEKRILKIDTDKIKDLPLTSSDIISEGAVSRIQKIQQRENDVKYFQSAYKGSMSNHDVESTDYIGTGEGNIAHGWGLYYAKDKNVGENYRRGLADNNKSAKYKYDGKNIENTKFKDITMDNLSFIETFGKDETINIIKEDIEYTEKWGKENQGKQRKEILDGNAKYLEKLKKELALVQELDASKLVMSEGQLYKVDIPENNELLEEQEPLSVQSDEVLNGVKKLIKDLFNIKDTSDLSLENEIKKLKDSDRTYSDNHKLKMLEALRYDDLVAKDFYNHLGEYLRYKDNTTVLNRVEAKKQASLLLNKYGVKGITYNGEQDGRCYVVFDDKAVKVLEKYYQGADDNIQTNMFYDNVTAAKIRDWNVKGSFVPAENLIELFKNADESTVIHEFAHWWLSRLEKYAERNEELALDLAEVRKFVKNNGEKFTREQHEKFAVGFEAYIRNGSARSNRLKRIFEDFKNALIQIYDSIKQLVYTENGNEYSFSESDVANLEKLFERLLTTENERIRKTVFDRCDDINERINDIKAKQEDEMKELDEIWKDNIAANNRASDKKRKVQEYLELAESAARKVPKEVRETKERYKKATLDILATVSGKSRQWVANPRNWEKLQEIVGNAADEITTQGGLAPEWAEFYTDTGVSYDNDEIDGDYKLAQQAFDVMADGSYNFNLMDENEIGDFYGKFDYLYGKILSLKGEEKTVALEALYSLFEKMPSMPDDVVADLVQKLEKVDTDYEEGQKEDFNKKHYPNIPVVQQLQFFVTNKLSQLKVYDPNVRYKVRISKSHSLYKAIKHATSVNATKRIVRKINEYVIADLENQAKNILHKEIQKQIRVNSKLVKVGTLSKGKFDWKTNTVFGELAEMNKMKQKEALKEYGAMLELDKAAAGEDRDEDNENPIATPELKTDFQSNLKRKFLEYRSSKIKDLNLAATRSLLEDIMTLKFEGRRAKDAQELEKQLQRDNMKTDLAYRVRLMKDKPFAQQVAKFIMGETPLTSEKTLVNWETALNALFGKEVAQRYSLLNLESEAEVYAYKHYSDFCQKAMELYGLNNPVTAKEKLLDKFNRFVDYGNIQPLVKLMQEYEEEVYNFKEVTYSKETGQFIETGTQLSKAEIITLYAWSMNEELEQRIFTQYGLAQVQYMFDSILSDEDKQFAWLLIDTCESMYDENNEVFIRTMGLSLPKVTNYFPSKTVRVGSEIDMLHENVVRSSNPSFIKQRKTCKRIKMKPEQPISILLPHINKTARYVILSERLNYLNAIFKDATVRAAIKEVFDGVEMPVANVGEKAKGKRGKQKRTVGDRIHDTLLNQLGASTFENYVRGLNTGKSWADALAANYITSRIGGNLKVMFGQLTSVINYAEKMPTGEWSKGFIENLKHPKETFKYMMDNCDYLKARVAGNSMNEIMSKITDEADRFRTLRNFCATNTKYGDVLAICFGGKPYIDYMMKQGMSEEEAFKKFVDDTLRAQQSGHNSATSIWQKKMSENFFTRMMFAFNNTSLQYERKFLDAISARAKGDIGNKELIKAILLYKVFNPIIFTSFLGNLSMLQLISSLVNGDDDDAFAKFGIDVGAAMAFANMGAYGFAGMGITIIGRFLMTLIDKKEYKPFLKTVPVIADIEEIGKKLIMKNDVSFADWVDAMALIGDDATGVPVSRLSNGIGGVGDMAQGNFGVGALRMFGYGNYRSHVAATGKPPKKHK